MSWSSWYALKNYVRSSYWVIPFLAVVLEQITLRILLFLERHIHWFPMWPFSDGATISVLQAIIGLVLSFIVLTFGSMLVAIQIASGQLTPRIIATTLLSDNVSRLERDRLDRMIERVCIQLEDMPRLLSLIPKAWAAQRSDHSTPREFIGSTRPSIT